VPVSFLSDRERERLGRFPAEIPPEDVGKYFSLSPADLTQVYRQRGEHNRLGFALQVCALRYLGFAPQDLATAPGEVVAHTAQQLGATADALTLYGRRDQTRSTHLLQAQAYLGYRQAQEEDLQALTLWLAERALEHDRPTLLFQLACDKLHRTKVVRPGVTRLEKLVASARVEAQQATYDHLAPLLTEDRRRRLDQLLSVDEAINRTRLTWLRQTATANSAKAILVAIARLDYVRSFGVEAWDLSAINPNRLKLLAQMARKATPQMLQRAPAERRYPALVAFLHQTMIDVTDEIIELYDRCLNQAYARSRRELEDLRASVSRSTNEKVLLLREIAELVADEAITDEALREAIYRRLPPDRLRTVIEECNQIVRPRSDPYYDFLAKRYNYFRQFAPAFLETLEFRSSRGGAPLVEAVAFLKALNARGRRNVPDDAPLDFIPARWERYVVGPNGRIVRRYWELCLLWELRNALRAGNIWLESSRQYADPASYLIPPTEWTALRDEVCSQIQVSADGEGWLRQREEELASLMREVDRRLAGHGNVQIRNGKLSVPAIKAEAGPERALSQQVSERLPRIELSDLLIEVDRWVQFSRHFEHAGGSQPRSPEFLTSLYASLFAQACNFGLAQFADLADLSYDRLAWCTNWYIREETLRAAVTSIVNYHHHLPLSRLWGGGTLSSSDGQRFPVSVRSKRAAALPRYFGYGRGLTYYTWTSDQFSQYGSKVITATVRDATYVLDEILDNETDLPIVEHTTDTAGYTELVFALFDLLGLRFSPRIRDLGDQRLYRVDRQVTYRDLEPAVKGTIRRDLILNHWDDMLRLAGSLKLGHVTASLYISKLQAYPRQSTLAQALQEYGRLVKTIFILRYLDSEAYRRRINVQLNKGEALHALRKFLFFANRSRIRQREDEDQRIQAGCLNLMTNVVIVWNTAQMERVIEDLKAEGQAVPDEDIAHISPARHEHINPYGRYSFNVGDGPGEASPGLAQQSLPGYP
jgi:TnpA family transposase